MGEEVEEGGGDQSTGHGSKHEPRLGGKGVGGDRAEDHKRNRESCYENLWLLHSGQSKIALKLVKCWCQINSEVKQVFDCSREMKFKDHVSCLIYNSCSHT